MPKQDDTHSCGPLALCGMLLRAAGLPLSMKVRNTSEVCLRLRTIVAAIAARVPTAEEGGGGAAIESALSSGLWLPVPVPFSSSLSLSEAELAWLINLIPQLPLSAGWAMRGLCVGCAWAVRELCVSSA